MTTIEWTGKTLNPSTGCDRVSPGCDHCYALTLAARLKGMGSAKYQHDGDPRTSGPGFGFTMHPRVMQAALRRKEPTLYFVNSMSDLFHAKATREFLAGVFAVMAATPQHTYQILTKRALRMRRVLADECQCGSGHAPGIHFRSAMSWAASKANPNRVEGLDESQVYRAPWPLPNVWLGTSVEDQARADERIPHLLTTPAAVRFLSCEPLLGPVTFRWAEWVPGIYGNHLDGLKGIDWVIVGGESGPSARRMQTAWAQTIVDQCRAASVPVFVKQLGSVLGGKAHHDIDTFPAGLRYREYPQAVSA